MKTNSTALQDEQNDKELVRQADEALKYAMQKENEARQALAQAIETTKTIRRKRDAAWQNAEARAVARRKAGLIEVVAGY